MGQDIGEPDEWNEGRRVEWTLTSMPGHEGISALVKDLNRIYCDNPELYVLDDQAAGFEWINNISGNESYLTYLRRGGNENQVLLVAANFSGIERQVTTGVPFDGKYKEIFNSDDTRYGGSGQLNGRLKRAKEEEWDDRHWSVTLKLAPLSLCILRYIPYTEEELEERRRQEEERARKAAEAKRRAEENAARKAAVKAAAKKAAKEAAQKVFEEAEKKAAEEKSFVSDKTAENKGVNKRASQRNKNTVQGSKNPTEKSIKKSELKDKSAGKSVKKNPAKLTEGNKSEEE